MAGQTAPWWQRAVIQQIPPFKACIGHLRVNTLFISANVRKAVNEGRADFTPVRLAEIPMLFRSGAVPLDVAMIHVTPPDAHGFCSYGVEIGVSNHTTAQVAALTTSQVSSGLTTTQVAALTTAQAAALTTASIVALSTAQVAVLTSSDVAALKTSQIAALTTTQISALKTSQIAALSTAQTAALEPCLLYTSDAADE